MDCQGVGSPKKPTTLVDDQAILPDLNLDLCINKENKESGHEKSTIVTTEPYAFTQNKSITGKEQLDFQSIQRKRRKFRLDPTLVHFDSLFGIDNWPRHLIFKTQTEMSAAKLENLLLLKYPTKEMSFRPINRKEWLVEATSKEQSEVYQSLSEINGIEVTVERHDKLNSIEGTVILPQINDCDGLPDEHLLLESLRQRYPNVENVKVYEIPNRKNPSRKLRIARIKFVGQTLPKDVKIEGQRREILPFIPKPLQCKNCSKFGHTYKKCRNETKCAFCGTEDHSTRWNCGIAKCCNCGQEHHARSKVCPFYIYNTELKLLMSRSGMSAHEAKLELKSRGLLDPSRNPMYRTAAKGKITPQAIKIYSENKHKEIPKSSIVTKDNSGNKDTKIPVSNFYEVLSQNEEETPPSDPELEENVPNVQRPKRIRDQTSPPSSKNSVLAKKRMLKLKRQTSSKENELDISPSPIFKSKIKTTKEIHQSTKENNECSSKGSEPNVNQHHDLCGCHECFIVNCNAAKPLTKDKLRNVIRNFISNKEKTKPDILEMHQDDCMCINHLLHYRENKISILDKFLDNRKHHDEIQSSKPLESDSEMQSNKTKSNTT